MGKFTAEQLEHKEKVFEMLKTLPHKTLEFSDTDYLIVIDLKSMQNVEVINNYTDFCEFLNRFKLNMYRIKDVTCYETFNCFTFAIKFMNL
jgi:regulator of sigma D